MEPSFPPAWGWTICPAGHCASPCPTEQQQQPLWPAGLSYIAPFIVASLLIPVRSQEFEYQIKKSISLSTPFTNIVLQLCPGLNAFLNRGFCASSPSGLILRVMKHRILPHKCCSHPSDPSPPGSHSRVISGLSRRVNPEHPE